MMLRRCRNRWGSPVWFGRDVCMSVRTGGSATPHGLPASSPAGSGIDGFAQSSRDWLLLAGRILLGGIFVLRGYGKLMGLSAFAACLERNGVPFPSFMALIGAPVEFFGGLAIILGIETRYAAALMGGFGIAAPLIWH